MKKPILKTWTEDAALKASNARYRKIERLLREIAGLWSDTDLSAVERAEELIPLVEGARLDAVLAVQARAEDRED